MSSELQKKPRRPHKPTDKLTIKQRAFVSAIATPGSPTFGNGLQSAIASNNGRTPGSAKVAAHHLLTRPNITTAVEEILNKHNIGIEVRVKTVKDIISQRYIEVEQLDADRELKSVTRMSNSKAQLSAIHMLNKLDGSYARAEALGHAQGKVLDPLIAEWTRRLRAELRQGTDVPSDTPPDAGSEATVSVDAVSETGTQEPTETQPEQVTEGMEDAITVIHEGPEDTGGGGRPTGVESNESPTSTR
jgi:phage terminase small subunit